MGGWNKWVGFTIRFNCKQNEKHDFPHYLILDRITDSKVINREGVWNKDAQGEFFHKINKLGVHLLGAQELIRILLRYAFWTAYSTLLNYRLTARWPRPADKKVRDMRYVILTVS